MDPIVLSALLGLGGKALEAGVGAWKTWVERGQGGVSIAADGSHHALPTERSFWASDSSFAASPRLEVVPFEGVFVPADASAETYFSPDQPVLLVIEDQDENAPLDSLVAVSSLHDGFDGFLVPGDYLLGAFVFLNDDPDQWDEPDGGGFVELTVPQGAPRFRVEVAIEVLATNSGIVDARATLLFGSGDLRPGEVHTYEMILEQGVTHRIYVAPHDPAADLNLYVYDENENLVEFDDDPYGDAQCLIAPRWTGPFSICVESANLWTSYEILVQE
ncbi:MAG TPA: hypothetical protein VHI71_06820 [Actinomycetota bacterium]|nr:hypothetical protein [Actinomycetota bacterium]